jgi:RimJ/RimL family protein N-acetyltransferase
MHTDHKIIFVTRRLIIRLAVPQDAELYFRLWTDPRVMTNVGFPRGLPISRQQIQEQIEQGGCSEFEQLLVVELASGGQAIGECKLGLPDPDKVASTDVKLLPEFWGHRYGVEVKRGLLDYLFTHTGCEQVEATPNKNNLASIRMQEAVGGRCVGEKLFQFPESMRAYTTPVDSLIYRVSREEWQARQGKDRGAS